MKTSEYHESVMVREVAEALHIQKGKKYIDATIGTGGYAVEVVKRGGIVLGIDLDEGMLEVAKVRLEEACSTLNQKVEGCFKLVQGNFKDIEKIAKEASFNDVSGITLDLGVSNIHLTSGDRGFSFSNPDALLDMRIDKESQGVTGADLLNALREDQLRDMFVETMDFGSSKWLSRRILGKRETSPIKSVGDFLEVCRGLRTKPGLNPATLPFLAVRIAVNSELSNLKEALPKAFELLGRDGRLVVVSFHSGEDRIVKDFFQSKIGAAKILTDKPISPSQEEITKNPKARSAKMRVLEKI